MNLFWSACAGCRESAPPALSPQRREQAREAIIVFTIPERPSSSFQIQNDAINRTADPGYFTAMQIPLIAGRFFTDQERLDRDHYMVVSKKFADQFFPGENPIGKHVTVGLLHETYEIVGVVGDTVYDVAEPIKAMMYFPILSGIPIETSEATLVVRTAGGPALAFDSYSAAGVCARPALPVYDILTMQQILGKSTATQSFSATLVLAFATLSLLLAAIGLYGVLSYLVAQRNTEIGIRMALGAQRARGVAAGVVRRSCARFCSDWSSVWPAALRRLQFIRSILYGTSPLDPIVLSVMVASLLLTAVIACVLPAIRASKIEPMQALRIE